MVVAKVKRKMKRVIKVLKVTAFDKKISNHQHCGGHNDNLAIDSRKTITLGTKISNSVVVVARNTHNATTT